MRHISQALINECYDRGIVVARWSRSVELTYIGPG